MSWVICSVCHSHPCQCHAAPYPWQQASYPISLPPAPPMGCICPPTSEQTCQNPVCPRKGPPTTASGTSQPSR
jgi:hypothetical protein